MLIGIPTSRARNQGAHMTPCWLEAHLDRQAESDRKKGAHS